MGPRKASEIFLNRHPEAVAFEVILYGSLAATGKGHLTDVANLFFYSFFYLNNHCGAVDRSLLSYF